ncbi:hypothetical protein PM082_024246 [Marasmius tenuissimus]|nr:hypothetical protein PM082_024246 [Marasmius tenuissimus]
MSPSELRGHPYADVENPGGNRAKPREMPCVGTKSWWVMDTDRDDHQKGVNASRCSTSFFPTAIMRSTSLCLWTVDSIGQTCRMRTWDPL